MVLALSTAMCTASGEEDADRGDETYFMLSGQGRHDVEIAALKLIPGADSQTVVRELRAALPDDVTIYTKGELLELDLEYWRRGTPISILLLVGVVFPVHFSWSAFGMVLALSMAMCTASGIFALRRTKTLDPAELF